MAMQQADSVYHNAECWLYEENKEIFALSTFLQHNLPCHCNCHNLSCVVEDCNMSEYSNNWPDSIFPNVNPHLSPQSDPIRESPDRSDTFWATLPASLSRPHGTANIFETSNTEAYALPMTDSLRSTQGPLNWHIAPQQDLSGSAFESFNTSMPSDLWLGESNNTEVCFSEPESLETSTEPEDQKCMESVRKPIRTVLCKQPDCGKTFRKKTDMDRHFESIHEGAGLLCGDCENNGEQSPPRRKDHFLPHLRKHLISEEITWESCRECPWATCKPANPKQTRYFSTQVSVEQHLRLRHEGECPSPFRQMDASSILLPCDQGMADPEFSLTGIKRTHDHETPRAKRLRCGDCAFDSHPAFHLREQGKERSAEMSDSLYSRMNNEDPEADRPKIGLSGFQNIQSQSAAGIGDYETFVVNVSPVDYLALLEMSGYKLKTCNKTFLPANSRKSKKEEMPVVSFSTSKRSILLRGPFYIVIFYKSFLEKDLEVIRSSKPLIYLGSAGTRARLGIKDPLRTEFKIPSAPRRSFRNSNKVFAVRKNEDAYLIKLWMKKIIPSLFKILDESIGNEYSASLVREGTSEQSARAVVRIESPHIPGATTRDDILQQIEKSCGIVLVDSGIEVQFSVGSLVLLAGNRQRGNNVNLDEKRELPFHTRYWKYPGMGASIGLLCTEEEFATLGCYVEIDKQKYVMTINHLIEKSYRKLENGVDDKHSLTSPALAKVKTMRKDLGHLLSILEGEMAAEFRKNFGDRNVSMADLSPLPKGMFEIRRKQELVSDFASELEKETKDFIIGSLKHQCEPNATAPLSAQHSSVVSAVDLQPSEMCHRMDWSLFKSDSRTGSNRHRYRYNSEDGTTDYFPMEKDHGEGDICQNTCVVESNEKVYFVGQTNGRVTGEINAALRAVSHKGRKTLEHHILMTAEPKKTGKDYAGDSGAVVLRISDNSLVGFVWGCFNNEVVFTPIRTVFADIQNTLKAKDVDLPKVQEDSTSNDVLLISGTESEVEKQRPFKSSDIVLPALSKEAAEKESQLLAASILESFKSNFASFPWSAIDTGLSSAQKERSSSPVPSLTSSRSPSPPTTPPSPSPGHVDLAATTDNFNNTRVIIREEFSFGRRKGGSQDCTTDDEEIDDCLLHALDAKHELLIPFVFDQKRHKPAKHGTFPGAQPPRLLRSLGTWPINSLVRGTDLQTERIGYVASKWERA